MISYRDDRLAKACGKARSAIWRRLVVIACEDVGVGDIDALLETLLAATSTDLRRQCGEASVLGAVVRRLAEAVKDRSADYLACAAKDHSDLSEICDFCRRASLTQRLQFLADSSQPLARRAVAAWFASGINWRYDQQVRGGDFRALAAAYRDLGAGEELSHSIVLAAKKAPEPLVILVPLVWLEVQRSGSARVAAIRFPKPKPSRVSRFTPSTRIPGSASARSSDWSAKTSRSATASFGSWPGARRGRLPRSRHSMRTARRWRAGSTGPNRIRWRGWESRQISSRQGSGLDGIGPVREAMNAALDQLNEIRAELWMAALAAGL